MGVISIESLKYLLLNEEKLSYRKQTFCDEVIHMKPTRCSVFPSLSLRRHAQGPLAKRLMHMAHLSRNTSGVSKS